MSSVPAIGALIADTHPPAQVLGLALLAERVGFDEIWLSEDYFLGGGIAAAASVLARTTVPIGLGVVPATGRHPAVLALELATLAGMFPKRLTAGIGAGIPEMMRRIGGWPRSPLRAVRDTQQALRTLLDGEMLSLRSDTFVADEVVLAHPPAHPPALVIGAAGPKMIGLSAAHADGTVLSVLSGCEYVRWARRQLTACGAGRTHRVVVYALCAIDADEQTARDMLRESVALFALQDPRSPLSEIQGFADEAEKLAAMDLAEAMRLIPERWLEELVVAGSPATCADRIRALGAAGADVVVLCFPSVPEAAGMIELAGRDLLARARV
jgi:alkanesulfonate monooxygenase SsuD/methylene tetrahydromethanopterin reductase-like flavin-dependent oxidoreductase (luciferase family)